MKEFDYKRAWKEAVYPGFLSLPQNIRDLFWETHIKTSDIVQLKDLSMPWPDDAGFKNKFNEIPDELLAKSARIIYCFGHWGVIPMCYSQGTYWKFSHYADQTLRVRFGMPEVDLISNSCCQVKVLEGLIRVCFVTTSTWSFHEVGLATKKNHEFVTDQLKDPEARNLNTIRAIKKGIFPRRGFIAKVLRTDSFMKEVEK